MKRPPRIGLMTLGSDASTWMGGIDYLNNLAHAICLTGRADVYLISGHKDLENLKFYPEFSGTPERIITLPGESFVERVLRRLNYPVYEKFRTARIHAHVARYGVDFLYPTNLAPSNRYGIHTSAWIPDFQHKHLPQYFTARECRMRDLDFDRATRLTSCTILSSQDARRDFVSSFPHRANKTEVLRFRTRLESAWLDYDHTEVRDRLKLPSKYLIVCNQLWQHKNHSLIIRSLKLLRERGHHPFVVFTGGTQDYRKPGFIDELLQEISAAGVSDNIRILGILPRFDQVQLIRGSVAVIQPSLFEGWSTVVEMARALARPILLSNLPVHLEQAPPRTSYFDPHSPEELANLILKACDTQGAESDLQQGEQLLTENRRLVTAFGEEFLDIVNRLKIQRLSQGPGDNRE